MRIAYQGVPGAFAPDLYRRLGCSVRELFCDVDGNFPNHHPDPTVEENLEHLKALVKEKGLDFGIAYDGDGDRIGYLLEEFQVCFAISLFLQTHKSHRPQSPDCGITR